MPHPFYSSLTMFTRHTIIATSILLLLTLSGRVNGAEEHAQYGSVEERRIANTILQERASIRQEREDLALKKKELKSIEEGVDKKLAELDSKIEELNRLKKKIEALLADKSAEEKKRTKELAAIYAKMTPAKAALALSSLDQTLAADLLSNMKVKSAAKILDQIPRQKASELSTRFSTLQLE